MGCRNASRRHPPESKCNGELDDHPEMQAYPQRVGPAAKQIASPDMFERYLPFAMAFGVGDKWAKAFEDIYREPPTWYVGGTGHFSATNFASSIGNMSRAAASSMSSSPSSSGSGGGGSSGGGSGGGGGSGF